MGDTNMFREATAEEKKDFVPLTGPKKADAKTLFNNELVKEQQKAIKAKKPFAEQAARDDFADSIDGQVKTLLRKDGLLDWSKVKVPKTEWAKYSDLKNFDLITEGEEPEPANGMKNSKATMAKFKKYKYKGYSNNYTVFE